MGTSAACSSTSNVITKSSNFTTNSNVITIDSDITTYSDNCTIYSDNHTIVSDNITNFNVIGGAKHGFLKITEFFLKSRNFWILREKCPICGLFRAKTHDFRLKMRYFGQI